MELFAVIVNRDDTVRVESIHVERETAQFYMVRPPAYDEPSRDVYSAYGYTSRIPKFRAYTSAGAALKAYMTARQETKADAQSVIGQATKQIASANELLMHLPPSEQPASAVAVDPVGEKVTG